MGTEVDTGELLFEGLRYYLAGEGVHVGDLLELKLDDRSWALGRYEWNCRPENRPSSSSMPKVAIRFSSIPNGHDCDDPAGPHEGARSVS
jgi:hypothetical protein